MRPRLSLLHSPAPSSFDSSTLSVPQAPTPNNTYLAPLTSSQIDHAAADDDDSSRQSVEDIGASPHALSFDPSIPSDSSRGPPSFASRDSSRPLLYPYPSDDVSSLQIQSGGGGGAENNIPFSTRPIPAPPLSLRSSEISAPDLSTPSTEGTFTSPSLLAKRDLPTDSSVSTTQEDVDAQRLRQLGYDAVLGREYTFWSSLCISWLNIGCLQGMIYAVSGAYSYGGPLMILVAWPISGILNICLTLTLSELASAYPVSGAMASWSWKVARGGVGGERGWGWLMGGVVLGGHVGNVLLVTWEIADVIAGTMGLSFDYKKERWHLLLFFLTVIILCGVVGSTSFGRSHRFWLLSGAYGLTIWTVLCITLLATAATRHGGANITTHFYNRTGWGSKAYVYILGWQYCTIASGQDASAHMAEETQNPSRNVPLAMTASIVSAYLLGYIGIVLLLLAVDTNFMAEVENHDFPFGLILVNAVNHAGAVSICVLLVFVLVLQVLAQMQASSRFLFAMARDNALPFADTIKRTNKNRLPVIAHWVVTGLCAPFAVLVLATDNTLYSVLAVTASSLSMLGYAVPVILYLFSKKNLQLEGRTSWSLRNFSKPVGAVGALYVVLVIVTQWLPGHSPISADNVSWSPVVLVGTGLVCFVTWKCYGDKHYSGPIRALTKWETGVEIDLQTTLASRSTKPSDDDPHRRGGNGMEGIGDEGDDDGLKVHVGGIGLEEAGAPLGSVVTVQSARTGMTGMTDSEWTSGTGSEWTSGTDSTATDGTVSRGQVRSAPVSGTAMGGDEPRA